MTIISVLLFSSCKNDCTPEQVINDDHFSIGYPGIMPFTGNDTLSFLKNRTDTIQFKGQGKQVFYKEIEVGGGDCPIKHRLLNNKINFIANTGENMSVSYYKYGVTSSITDFFEMLFNNSLKIGPQDVDEMYISSGSKIISLDVLGKNYPSVLPLPANTDTIYISGPDAHHQIVRIKYQSNIYEVFP